MPEKIKSITEPKKATSERMTLPGETRARVVYVGSNGGKYVKKDGKYVALKSLLPESGKKSRRIQKGGEFHRHTITVLDGNESSGVRILQDMIFMMSNNKYVNSLNNTTISDVTILNSEDKIFSGTMYETGKTGKIIYFTSYEQT